MVSFQAPPLSPNHQNKISTVEDQLEIISKKRKYSWEEDDHHHQQQQQPTDNNHQKTFNKKRSRPHQEEQGEEKTKSLFDIELHLETPLPLEWQRCLDIQSGQIHFYNTRTHKRTSRDPRSTTTTTPEPPSSSFSHHHMSLDLELNLLPTCDSLKKSNHAEDDDDHLFMMDSRKHRRCPSWLAVPEQKQLEMVATVCTQCHMLVMLCKSSPACPNCKFMHPPDQTPPPLFKGSCSLFSFAN